MVFFRKKFFPKLNTFTIYIQPSLYGTIGSYEIKYPGIIYLYPRFDRKIGQIQKLLINALTHYFYFNPKDEMSKPDKVWYAKQKMAKKIQEDIFPESKDKAMIDILDRQFAGRLAEESIRYLCKLGLAKPKTIKKPKNLTKKEGITFDLFYAKRNKIVAFEEIGDAIWGEKAAEKYSEYAITKLVERLKKKLPENTIHSQRKLGYILIF